MAKANKCDICGNFYDPKDHGDNDIAWIKIIDKQDICMNSIDLCPQCSKQLEVFWKIGGMTMQELEKILEEIGELRGQAGSECTSEDHYIKKAWEHCLDRVVDIIRKHMNDGWIPVDDRLPKTNGTYNVTRHIDGHFISDSAYFDGQNTWHSDNRVNHSRPYLTDVIAWRPLSEPYRPERSNDEKK